MAELFVDLSAQSMGSGTELSPFNNFSSINTAGWSRDDIVRIKRGSSQVLTAATRANINCNKGAGRLIIDAYGDSSLPLPVLSGGGSNFNPFWIQGGNGVTVRNLHVTNTPGSGFSVTPTAGLNISDVIIEDCLATRTNQNPALLGEDGCRIGSAQLDGGTVANVRVRRFTARDCGGHGLKVRGKASDVIVDDIVAIRCGSVTPAHGFGTAGGFTNATGGWSLISGNVYERATTSPLQTSLTEWKVVYVLGNGTVYRLPFVASATPGVNEAGIGAPNTLRLNLGGTNPNTLSSIQAIYEIPDTVWFINGIATGTYDVNGIEGQGVYFDNGSIRCWSRGCVSYDNVGPGFFMNDCTDSGHYGGLAYNNGRAAASTGRGLRTSFFGNTLVCKPGTPGIDWLIGNVSCSARSNQIVDASIGMTAFSTGGNAITEDMNAYVNCAQRLNNIVNAGAKSFDTSTQYGRVSLNTLRRVAAAEIKI